MLVTFCIDWTPNKTQNSNMFDFCKAMLKRETMCHKIIVLFFKATSSMSMTSYSSLVYSLPNEMNHCKDLEMLELDYHNCQSFRSREMQAKHK